MKYIIMKSAFGDYWIGKTKLKLPNGTKAFRNFDDAQAAMGRCTQCENRDELEFMEEEEIEEIDNKDMLKWLVR